MCAYAYAWSGSVPREGAIIQDAANTNTYVNVLLWSSQAVDLATAPVGYLVVVGEDNNNMHSNITRSSTSTRTTTTVETSTSKLSSST